VITIAQARKSIGTRVVYQQRRWVPDDVKTAMAGKLTGDMQPTGPAEAGVITSVNDRFIFVRFDDQPEDAAGKACPPGTLDPAGQPETR